MWIFRRQSRGGWWTCVVLAGLLLCSPIYPALASSNGAEEGQQPEVAAAMADGRLTLEESMALARSTSQLLSISQQQLRAAEAKLDQAKAGFWPQLSVSSSFTRTDTPSFPTGEMVFENMGGILFPNPVYANQAYQTQLQLQLPVFTGGRLLSAQEQAELGLQSSGNELAKTGLDLDLQVENAYYGVLRARGFEKLAQQALDQVIEHRKVLEAMYQAGMAIEADLIRVRAQEASARQNLLKAGNARDLAEDNLRLILGLPQEAVLPLDDVLNAPEEIPSYEEVLAAGLQGRPELVKARLTSRQAGAGVGIARSAMYPNVFLSANYGWMDTETWSLENGSWSATVGVSWSLFDAGAGRARLKEAQAMARQAELAAQQTEDAARLEIKQLWLSLVEAQQGITTAELDTERAQVELKQAEAKFRVGAGTSVDVLDAQTTLAKAEETLIQAKYDYHLAAARLKRAVGMPIFKGEAQ